MVERGALENVRRHETHGCGREDEPHGCAQEGQGKDAADRDGMEDPEEE